MSKDKSKTKDKSKRRESSSSSSSKKSRKSLDTSAITLPTTSSTSTASTSTTVTSAFETLYPILNLPIPPVFSSDPYAAFSDLMDTLVMRYIPPLSGVLITHSPTRFLQDTALFSADSAFATASLGFECVVWRPKIGQMLEGTIALSSPSHVSLLLYGLFNASIPASHLPEDEWEFVLNGEEQGVDAAQDRGMGYWRNKIDGSRLGGSDGKLKFTVISLTIANHMLSLHGSLLPDPLSGPPPTLDRSYLKKSLLPQAFGLGAINAAGRDTREASATAEVSPAPTPRRVRWEDEDEETDANAAEASAEEDSGDEQEDVSQYDTPVSVVKSESSKKGGKEKTKRKSTSGVSEDGDAATDSPKREKKRRKEA